MAWEQRQPGLMARVDCVRARRRSRCCGKKWDNSSMALLNSGKKFNRSSLLQRLNASWDEGRKILAEAEAAFANLAHER